MAKSSPGLTFKSKAVAFAMMIVLAAVAFCAMPLVAHAAVTDAPATSKKLLDNGDGTYTLALSVTGATESSTTTEATKANVILVVDTSNSMNGSSGTQGVSRLAAEKDALTKTDGIIDNLLKQNVAGDPIKSDIIEVAVVNFDTSGHTAQSFTTNGTTLKNTIDGLTTSTGTNWEEGLQYAKNLADNIKTSQPDEEVYVIFLTDGEPTTHAGSYRVNTDYAQEWGYASDDAHAIVDAGYNFYALFTWGSGNSSHYLSSLVQYAYTGSGNSNSSLDSKYAQYFTDASDTETLIEALNQIVSDITTGVGYTEVELEDGVTSMTTSNVKTTASGEVTNMKYYRSGGDYSTTANNGLGDEWVDAPKATINSDGEVDWDLGSLVLENGVTYTMTFVVWPSQESVDLVADLNNGVISYESLSDEQKSQINVSGGNYTLKTNTDYPTVTYSTVTTTTVDGKTTTVVSDPTTTTITNPDPVGLSGAQLNAVKAWEDTLDPSQREEIDDVVLNLKVDGTNYYEKGVTLTAESNWTDTDYIYIAPGLMVTANSPAWPGEGAEGVKYVTYEGATYALLEEGHDYVFEESDINNHFELTAYTHHPMIMGENADGTPHIVDVVFNEDGTIESVSELGDNLSATNTLKGGINITKKVVGENGNEIEDLNPFTVTVTVTDPDGKALPTKKTADGTEYTIDYRIYYGENNPNYDAAAGGGRSDHIYVSGTEFTETIYVGDTIRVVNVEDDSLYSVEETVPTGYSEEYKVDYKIAYGTGTAAAFPEGEKPSVQGNSVSYADITNTYTYGNLEVSKTVEVESGDEAQAKDKDFEFTFKLYDKQGGTALTGNKYTYTKTDAEGAETTGTIEVGGTFKLKDGETLKIDKLPETAYYEVVETAVDGFETTPQGGVASGTIVKNTTAEAEFTNTYSVTPVKVDPPVKKDITGTDSLYNKGNFTFTIANTAKPDSVTTAPMPAKTEITNIKDNELVDKPGYYEFGAIAFTEPGTYTYAVTESGSAVGVTNDTEATKTLTFTVTDNGDGTMTVTPGTDSAVFNFTNFYKTGELDITKTVVNDVTSPDNTKFTFTVEFKSGNDTVEGSFPYTIGETTGDIASGGTLQLANGEKAVITEIPDGVTYTVTETAVDGYDTAKTGDTGTISATIVATAAFTNTYGVEPTTASFPVKKVLSVPEGLDGPEEWEYSIAVSGTPAAETMTGTVDQDSDTVTFGPITYTAPGTYTYTVTETGEVKGVTNDSAATTGKTVTVTVVDNGNGTMTATASSTENAPVTFTNTYGVEPTTASFPVKKALSVPEGLDGPEEWEYTVNVVANDGAPEAETMTGKVNQDIDTVTFGDFTYTMPGTYTYTVSESGAIKGVTNDADAAGKTVSVTVVDNHDGTMTATADSTIAEPLIFTNVYSAEDELDTSTEAVLTKTVVADGTAWAPKTFEFTIEAVDGAPLGVDAEGNEVTTGTATFNEAGTQIIDFGKITYTEAGEYTYNVTETTESGNGWVCDNTTKTLTVNVVDNGDGTLTATPTAAKIENTYKPTGTLDTSTTAILSKKTEGEFDGSKTFEFTIEAVDGAPLGVDAEGNEVTTGTATFTEAGTQIIDFGTITYTKAGTYTYTVTETTPSGNGWTCDNEPKTVSVTVTDDGKGNLTATPAAATITNTYAADGKDVTSTISSETSVDGELVQAGDTLTYTIEYANTNSTAATVTIVDSIPSNTTYVDGSASDGGVYADGAITWTIKDVPAGKTGTVTFQVTVNDNAKDVTIENTALVSDGENQSSTNAVTTSVPVKDVVDDSGDSIDGEGVKVGDELTYEVSFTLTEAGYAVVTDDVPEGTELVKAEGATVSGKTLTWNFGSEDEPVEAGNYTVTFTVKVTEDAVTKDAITNTASINVNNHGDVKTNTVTNTPEIGNLMVSKTVTVPEGFKVDADKAFTFTITLTDQNDVKLTGKYAYTGDYEGELTNGSEFKLKDGETITISGLPAGAKYSITETAEDGYTAKQATISGAISEEAAATAAFENVYATEATKASIPATKTLVIPEGLTGPTDPSWTFEIKAESKGAPMPETTSYTVKPGETVTFADIEYTKPGDYQYALSESGEVAGVTNDAQPDRTVTVEVVDNGDGTLTATPSTNKTPITFTNTYSVTSVTLPTEDQFHVTKDLKGTPLTAGAFEFALTAVDPTDAPMPEKTEASNDAAGEVIFDTITYDKPGEYKYTITEKNAGKGGYTYSENVTNVFVTVTDNGKGALEATVAYTGETVFNNTYEADGTVDLSVAKELKGRTLEEGQFAFQLLDEDGKVLQTKTNNASGAVQFDTIEYDESIFDEADKKDADEKDATEEGDEVTTQADEKKAASDEAKSEEAATADTAVEEPASDEAADAEAAPEADATVNDDAAEAVEAPASTETEADAQESADDSAPATQAMSILPQAYADDFDDSKIIANVSDAPMAAEASDKAEATETADADEPALKTAADDGKRSATVTYKIREVNDGKAGYKYDDHTVTVTVTVTDNGDGTLTATPAYDGTTTFTNTYEAEGATGEGALSGVKTVTGKDLADGQFSFQLKEGNEVLQTVTNGADGSFSFAPLTYVKNADKDETGTHTYTIVEVNDGQLGYTYDSHVCTVTVEVVDNGDGTLKCTTTLSDGDAATFNNPYDPLATSAPIKAVKVLDGRDLKADEFSFELADEAGNVVATATNAADGTVDFGNIAFDEVGTFTYTATEVKGDDATITYDTAAKTYKVEITDEAGQLVAKVTCDGGETATFTNKYTPKETPPVPIPAALPKTGDGMPVAILVAIAVLAAAVCAVAARRRTLAVKAERRAAHSYYGGKR